MKVPIKSPAADKLIQKYLALLVIFSVPPADCLTEVNLSEVPPARARVTDSRARPRVFGQAPFFGMVLATAREAIREFSFFLPLQKEFGELADCEDPPPTRCWLPRWLDDKNPPTTAPALSTNEISRDHLSDPWWF